MIRTLARLLCALLLALLASPWLTGCAAFPPPTAGLALQAGPCGLEYVATAAAGVPLEVPVGAWVVRVEASGGATVTLAQPCKDAAVPQVETQEPK
jgi:hypothetical protein